MIPGGRDGNIFNDFPENQLLIFLTYTISHLKKHGLILMIHNSCNITR